MKLELASFAVVVLCGVSGLLLVIVVWQGIQWLWKR